MMSRIHKMYLLDLAWLALVIGVIYSVFLGTYALVTPDEARYAEIAREMLMQKQFLTPHLNHVLYFEKPPFFYWLLSSVIFLFGLSEWAMRLLPAMLALIGALSTYIFAHFFYDRKTGIYACLILSSSFLYFAMGHLITLDMAVSTFITLTLFFIFWGLEDNLNPKTQGYYFLASAIMAAFAVLTKGLIGLIFPTLITGAWMIYAKTWKNLSLKWFFIALSLFLLIALPWHILMQIKYPYFFHFYFIEQQFARFSTDIASRTEPFYFYFVVFFIGFFPWCSFMFQTIISNIKQLVKNKSSTEFFLLFWLFFILIFFSFSQSKLIPYIIPIFPPMAILLARYFVALENKRTKGFYYGIVFFALLCVASAIALLIIPHYYPAENPRIINQFFMGLSILLLLWSIPLFYLVKRIPIKTLFIIIFIGISIFEIIMLRAIPYLDHLSIEPLSEIILAQEKPGNEVVSYNHYYQDLPFYTRHIVTVVNCASELDFGVAHDKNTANWMIDDQTFWKRWHGKNRLFVVTRIDDYNDLLKSHPDVKFYVLGKTSRNILLSNRSS